jgi:nucleolar protein 12
MDALFATSKPVALPSVSIKPTPEEGIQRNTLKLKAFLKKRKSEAKDFKLDGKPEELKKDEDESKKSKKRKIKEVLSMDDEKELDFEKDTPERKARTVFVGNLPVSCLEKEDGKKLRTKFSVHGKIETIRFRSIGFSNSLPKRVAFQRGDFHPERDTLNAYVVYSNIDEAKAALSENATTFNEKHIRVDLAETSKNDMKRSVFVGNLPFDAKEEALWEFFSSCGNVANVRLIRDSKTSLGKGFGYVQFQDKSSVALAIQLNGASCCGRNVRVFRCKNKEKSEKDEKKVKSQKVRKMLKKSVKKQK